MNFKSFVKRSYFIFWFKKIQTGVLSHPGLRRYGFNASWLMAEKTLRMIIGLFVGVWVARYLGPDNFGLLSYAQSFVGLFTVFATMGLDGIVVRELVRNYDQKEIIIGTAFGLSLVGAIIVLTLLALSINFVNHDQFTNKLIFLVAGATVFQSFNVIDFFFQSQVMSRYVVFANFISLTISSVIKIVLILINAPLMYFAAIILFDSIILALGLIYFFFKKTDLTLKRLSFSKRLAVCFLKDCWPLVFSSAILMIQARIDQVMIKMYIGNSEVGHYSVAMRFVELFAFLPVVLKNSLLPAIINAKNSSKDLYQKRLSDYYRLSFILFLIIGVPIFFYGEFLIITLYGSEYKVAGCLLALMSTRLFFTNMGTARGAFILAENLLQFSLITMIAGTITNIVLNYYWIPIYGSKGAIVATIFSFFVTIFLFDIFYCKTRKNMLNLLSSICTFYKISLRGL